MDRNQDKVELFQALEIREVEQAKQRFTIDWCCSFDDNYYD